MSVRDFIAATAAKTPTPGGGSVAGAVGAMGAALAEMALNFTRGKKKFAEHEEYYAHLQGRLRKYQALFGDLVRDDVEAYRLYQESTRQGDGPQKEQAVQLALAAATHVPRESAKVALALLEDLRQFAPRCSPYLVSDLLASGTLAVAAVRLSDYNVRINVPQLADRQAAADIGAASRADLQRAAATLEEIEQSCKTALP